ncbi:MAG TPA: DUF4367 domain-containing protein [Clostridiales bacterium]|nr:DUF4367 domain-containing protein [Clostridiales bacterium]
MPEKVEDIMKEVGGLSLQAELQRMAKWDRDSVLRQPLSLLQIKQLANKISLLPFEYQGILLFKHCFNNTISGIEEMLGTENAQGKLNYLEKLLSGLLGLRDAWIATASMEEACNLVLEGIMKEYDSAKIVYKPEYSKSFRQKLKEISIKKSPAKVFLFVAKQVAIFLLVLFLAFSSVLVVSVEARTKFFDWVLETFPEFSLFQSQNNADQNDPIELTDLNINYVPDGFVLSDMQESGGILSYRYVNENNMRITIRFVRSSGSMSSYYNYYNTEKVGIEDLDIKGIRAYMWQIDEVMLIVWSQDGVECHIVGEINKEEIIKMAENITK